MITPEYLAAPDTEHAHQTAFFCWAAEQVRDGIWPDLKFMYAIPNGGERNEKVGAKLKAEGVRKGVPDICLPKKRGVYSGIYIEMKRPKTENHKKGQLTPEQKEFFIYLAEQDYYIYVCYTWIEARTALLDYLNERFNQSGQRRHTI